MKYIILSILLTCTAYQVNANVIDSLHTKKEVERFLIEYVDSSTYNGYSPFIEASEKITQYPQHYGTDSFYIADLDNNGLNDLIIDSRNFLIILDSSGGKFSEKWLGIHDYTFKQVLALDTAKAIVVDRKKSNLINLADTFIYKNGAFIEFYSQPSKHIIERIVYDAGPCFGSCPVYSMTIDSDRKVCYYKYNIINSRWDTTYATSVFTELEYEKIVGLLNYMNFDRLEDDYFYGATDLPSADLAIYYNGSKLKKISDYGKAGTCALNTFYDLLDGYYYNKKWDVRIAHGPKYHSKRSLRKSRKEFKKSEKFIRRQKAEYDKLHGKSRVSRNEEQ